MAKESAETDSKRTTSSEGKTNFSGKKSSKRLETNNLPTKVAIRHLPPSMTLETFVEEVSPLPDHNYLWFANPDKSLGQYAFARAYINFCHQEDVFTFTEKFDGYVFVDKKGDEYCAIVEFAPFQKVPKMSRKKDAKCGTIETDQEYLKFLENKEKLAAAKKSPPTSTAETLEEITTKERELKASKGLGKCSTPLLDYLRKKKEDKIRIREEKKEERKKKEVEKRKQRDDERRKHKEKEQKRPTEKVSKHDKPTRIFAGKSVEEKKTSEEELTSNLKTLLKISEPKEQESKAPEHPPDHKKPAKEGKPERPEPRDVKKKEFKKRERKPPPSNEERTQPKEKEPKGDAPERKPHPKFNKAAHQSKDPKEVKSYKEERQKMQEARAARAAAKQEGRSQDAEGKSDPAEGPSSNNKPSGRLRNKDRPAMQIYRPGMLKSRTSDGKPEPGETSEQARGKDEE